MHSLNGINALLFDLDGTLRHSCPDSAQFFFDQAVRLGASDSEEKRLQAYHWAHRYWSATTGEILEDIAQHQHRSEAFWEKYTRRHLIAFGCSAAQAEDLAPDLHRYMKEYYDPINWVPPEVMQTLETLHQAEYRMAVVSNRSEPCQEELVEWGLAPYFEFALVAGEIGIWKPEAGIFHYALERMGTRPEATLYIGDNYYADVIGATRAGLQPILIDPRRIFPEATCPVVDDLSGVLPLLGEFSRPPKPQA